MDFKALLLRIAPIVDAAIGNILDFIAWIRDSLWLTAIWEWIFTSLGELFARWGWSII